MNYGKFLLIFAGCTSSVPPPPVVQAPRARPVEPGTIEIVAPAPLRPRFDVVPAELGDPGIGPRLGYRARVRSGRLWISLDDKAAHATLMQKGTIELPVAEVLRDRMRIVIDDDGAHYVAWIDRADAATVPIAPIELADRDGRAHPTYGVFLVPGAPLEVGPIEGGRRAVHVRDPEITVTGFLPAGALDQIYPAPAPKLADDRSAYTKFDATLDRDAVVRAGRSPDAPVLATGLVELNVKTIGAPEGASTPERDEVIAIEIERPFGRIRGFAPKALVHRTDAFGTTGIGLGHSFGMSHADRVNLAVGACLFAGAAGEVIGVSTDTKERYAHAPYGSTPAGWWKVYVDSPWGSSILWAHDTANDRQNPAWELCGSYRK